MLYAITSEDESVLLNRIKIVGAKLKCSIEIYSFSMWSAYITNLAYYCVSEIAKISDSDLLRLSADEIYVILRILICSRKHSNATITSFILK